MTGKEMYKKYWQFYYTNAGGLYSSVDAIWEANCRNDSNFGPAWDALANFTNGRGGTAAGSTIPFDLTALLKRYGRHNPRCATGFDCSCGWDEAVKLVGLEEK
jgi:hypothetical protein